MKKHISKKEFLSNNVIYFDNIMDGFENCLSFRLEGNKEYFRSFLKEVMEANGMENCYCDFYYNILEKEGKEKFEKGLSHAEKILFQKMDKAATDIYYYLTEDMLEFTLSITSREWMFSTFYFSNIPCTLWGNYNMTFPLFFKEEKDGQFYKNIAVKNNLKVSK